MTLCDKFLKKYGNKEIDLPYDILTIYDMHGDPFSSGSNGYLTKIRVRNYKFEFYHNWWNYGWLTKEEIERKYPHVSYKVNMIIPVLLR